uniref:Trichohyalin-plectin-homology domain-containing protein n=1 Tax=Timema bartmani TaxID=61472 RepID=A0A7R9ETT6_9NEOP|nr:unnamed protein product [Timema bartmani]
MYDNTVILHGYEPRYPGPDGSPPIHVLMILRPNPRSPKSGQTDPLVSMKGGKSVHVPQRPLLQIGKESGSSWKSQKLLRDQRHLSEENEKNESSRKELLMKSVKNQFEATTELKSIFGGVRNQVQLGMRAVRQELDQRRDKRVIDTWERTERQTYIERDRKIYIHEDRQTEDRRIGVQTEAREQKDRELRQLLLEEEDAWSRKVVNQAQRVDERKYEEMKKRATELRNKRRNAMEAKEGQLYQIQEKQCLQERQKEIERMWEAIMKKEVKAKTEREIEEARQRYEAKKDMAGTLKEQLMGRRMQEEERKKIQMEEEKEAERIKEEVRREEIRQSRRKKEELADCLLGQIKTREDLLKQHATQQNQVDEAFAKALQREIEKEKAATSNHKGVLRREIQMYHGNLEELRLQKKRQSEHLEALIQEETTRVQAVRDEARAKLKEARERLLKV